MPFCRKKLVDVDNRQNRLARRRSVLPPPLQKLMPKRGVQAAKRVADPSNILFVEGIPRDFPCKQAAIYLLHAAQDGGYGTITILKPPNHRHEFRVLDLVRDVAKRHSHRNPWCGPSLAGIKMRDECWFDYSTKLFQVGPMPRPEARLTVTGE
ncbi:MAG: hypothetical protein ACE5H7_13990 [Acidiferrobacterales bacterium]